jgi:hypothetical protein
MSQLVQLTNLLPHYNSMVESLQSQMQSDNNRHIDAMIDVYGKALEGGASSKTLSYLEEKMANRDNYNIYRRNKDAEEWFKVDKKLHSYLGRDMKKLAGGQHGAQGISQTKEPHLVQSLKLLSAYVDNLSKKMMQARTASCDELREAVTVLVQDEELEEQLKGALQALQVAAEAEDMQKTKQHAGNLVVLGSMTEQVLPPVLSNCILKCGLSRNLPSDNSSEVVSVAPVSAPVSAVVSAPVLEGGCGQNWMKGGHDKPQFRSAAAAQLFNLIHSK